MSAGGSVLRRVQVETMALGFQKLLGQFASAFCGLGLSVLLGFDPLPSIKPLQALWSDDRIATVAILAVIAVIGVASFLITRRGKQALSARNQVLQLLRLLSQSIIDIVIGFLAGLVLGVGSAPSTVPLLGLIRDHPPIGIGIGLLLLAILIIAPLIVGAEEEAAPLHAPSPQGNRVWLATATSFVSLSLLLTLLGMVTLRPAWCPTTICPAPRLIVVTNAHGVNDGTMEAYYLAQQSNAYVLTEDPSAYNFNHLPDTVAAVEIGQTELPYRAVVGIHSLQRNTQFGLILDGVEVILDNVSNIQAPANVFVQTPGVIYDHNIFTFKYAEEGTSATLPTDAPPLTITLEVGGSDEVAVQVTSRQEINLGFHLRVTYHQILGSGLSRTLVVPHEFEVAFIAPAHWKPYTFSGGQMVPQPPA